MLLRLTYRVTSGVSPIRVQAMAEGGSQPATKASVTRPLRRHDFFAKPNMFMFNLKKMYRPGSQHPPLFPA